METKEEKGCGGGCAHCSLEPASKDAPEGRKLVLPAIGIFLFPIVLAIVGAFVFRQSQERQALAAFAGLLIGMVIAG